MKSEQLQNLRARAAFDPECDAQQIQLTPLDTAEDYADLEWHKQHGVRGCGHRTTYIDAAQTYSEADWVANGVSE